jgi:hypothetical protein
MAKNLGIKPGSDQFHALKNGDFGFSPGRSGKGGASHSGGKDKRNGKGQDDRPMAPGQTDDHGGGKGKKK